MITFDFIGEAFTIKYVLLDYIRASYSAYKMLVGSRGDLGCLMAQVLVMMFRTVIIYIYAQCSTNVAMLYIQLQRVWALALDNERGENVVVNFITVSFLTVHHSESF